MTHNRSRDRSAFAVTAGLLLCALLLTAALPALGHDALPQSHPGDLPFQFTALLRRPEIGVWGYVWECIKVFGPIVGAFFGFYKAAKWNYDLNRKLQDRARRSEAASLAAAVKVELKKVLREIEVIQKEFGSPDFVGNPPLRDAIKAFDIRPLKILDALTNRITLLERDAILSVSEALDAINNIKKDLAERKTRTGQMQSAELDSLLHDLELAATDIGLAIKELTAVEVSAADD